MPVAAKMSMSSIGSVSLRLTPAALHPSGPFSSLLASASSPFVARSPIWVLRPIHRRQHSKRFRWTATRMAAAHSPEAESGTLHAGGKTAVVCGGGVIGASTAYFLGKKGIDVTVIEKGGVACASSGKAGGFLALDWCDSSPVGPLARASFKLHEQLSTELGQDYGYRRVDTLSLTVQEPSTIKRASKAAPGLPKWVDGPVKGAASIGGNETTGQVHPKLFTQALINTAKSRYGTKLRIGAVEAIGLSGNDAPGGRRKVTHVIVDGEKVETDAAVIAMGPWSGKMSVVSELCAITGLKAHSIVLKPPEPDKISATCLFLSYRTKSGQMLEPEVYPRPTGEVYVCGVSEEGLSIPDDPQQVLPRKGAPEILKSVAATISSDLANAEVTAEQACFLPISEDGVPLIGQVPGVEGLYVATGHSCWGILNGPATGASLAELMVDGKSSLVDLRPFDPQRFVRSNVFAR
jgi:glycine/D-amino acid oxidase-like deaminating enzyme